MAKERVNIYKIAKEAGVSPATVSRVMTNNAKVSKEKRERVEQVIAQYGYSPNALAQALSTSKTRTIGIMIADIASPFYSTIAAECEKAARELDYMILMISSLGDYELEKKQLIKLYEQQVDAIVLIGGRCDQTEPDENYVELINRIGETIPIISTGTLAGIQTCRVSLDESGSMDLAMKYLFSLGHKEICLIGGMKTTLSTFEKRTRFRTMLRQEGLVCREEFLYETSLYNSEGGYQGTKKILELSERPSAIIAINDHTAAGVIQALHEASIRVPEDISLISFDNTFLSASTAPQLTSIGCDYQFFARILLETVVKLINQEPVEKEQVIPVELHIRESCMAKD